MDKKALTFLLCAILVYGGSCFLHSKVDPFYLKALQDGKTSFHEGRYEQASQDLNIAQFGLLEEKEYLPELYLYFALSRFKLKKIEEARILIKDLKTKLNIKDPNALPTPAGIKGDVESMLLTLEKYDNPPVKTKKAGTTAAIIAINPTATTGTTRVEGLKPREKSPQPITKKNTSPNPGSVEKSFAPLFRETLEKVKENNPGDSSKQVEKNLKKLERLNKSDARVFYLKALVAFNQRKYKACIKLLEKIVKIIGPTFREDVYYYLVRSYYFVKKYRQVLALYQQIQDPAYREKLAAVIREVMEIRKTSVHHLSGNFSPQGLKTLIRQFPGDRSLCTDILDSAIKANPRPDYVIQVIRQCEKQPRAYNEAFIQGAANYLKSMGKIEKAIKMIKNSKFYNSPDPNHVELHYQLGRLYLDKLELQKALVQMRKVKGMQNNYKKTDYLIEKINFLINRSRRIP
jgi:tetratricopeptide (TPR) repeat protein